MANVLVVDDAAFMRLSIKQILEKNGHTMIAEAGNGKEAILRYTECKPDVTILDITMPEMSGLDALSYIKKIDPSAKIVICSALGQQEQLAKAIQLGAKDFIVKPFEPDRMIAALNKVLLIQQTILHIGFLQTLHRLPDHNIGIILIHHGDRKIIRIDPVHFFVISPCRYG